MAVQATHAALQSAWHFSTPDIHPNLVILAVPDLAALRAAGAKLTGGGVRWVAWTEADMNDELTAIATETCYDKQQRKVLREFQLLKGCTCQNK